MSEKERKFKAAMTLALAVLMSWEEDDRREPGKRITRSWKGFVFDVLDVLEERGFVRAARSSRSMQITENGKIVGGELLELFRKAYGEEAK